MTESKALINIDAKPIADVVNNFINKIASATGTLYEPRRIRSIARAEADALEIGALAEFKVETARRAFQRAIIE